MVYSVELGGFLRCRKHPFSSCFGDGQAYRFGSSWFFFLAGFPLGLVQPLFCSSHCLRSICWSSWPAPSWDRAPVCTLGAFFWKCCHPQVDTIQKSQILRKNASKSKSKQKGIDGPKLQSANVRGQSEFIDNSQNHSDGIPDLERLSNLTGLKQCTKSMLVFVSRNSIHQGHLVSEHSKKDTKKQFSNTTSNSKDVIRLAPEAVSHPDLVGDGLGLDLLCWIGAQMAAVSMVKLSQNGGFWWVCW